MSSMNSRMAVYAGAKVIHTDSRDLQRFLEARDRGAPAAELRELRMAAQMSPETAREIEGRNSAARSRRAGNDRKIRFLRKIPKDPITGQSDWNLLAVQDDPDSTSWGGKNVFDVHSKSQGTASDGTKYSEW